MCRSKYVEHLINIEIINSSTRLHLVGYFCMIYVSFAVVHLVEVLRYKSEGRGFDSDGVIDIFH